MSTIAAIATPYGLGGVAMIRLSGDDAISIAADSFLTRSGRSLNDYSGYQAAYGDIIGCDGMKIDDGIALVFRAPHSYTGEDVVEITCHGGVAVSELVLRCFLDRGALLAGRGEFTKRAFLNGKMDLTAAEGVIKLIESESEASVRLAAQGKDGKLQQKIRELSERMISIAANIQVLLDYPEEEIPETELKNVQMELLAQRSKMRRLLQQYRQNRIVREGAKIVFVGEPNVGKSTLINQLCGEDKSIVTDIPGTTRDAIEVRTRFHGVLTTLIDTAGLRYTEDPIEKIGVEKAKNMLADADIVIFVLDSSRSIEKQLQLFRQQETQKSTILVVNKVDLNRIALDGNEFERVVYTSQKMEETINRLRDEIAQTLKVAEIDPNIPGLLNERQYSAILQSEKEISEAITDLEMGVPLDLVSISLEEGIDALLELTGEKASEEVIDQIFSKFCVGK